MSLTFKDFKVLVPAEIHDSAFIYSSIPEPDTTRVMGDGSIGEVAWAYGTDYAQNARVYMAGTNMVYRDSVGGVSNDPPSIDPVRWIEEGPTNKWAWHDSQNGTESIGSSPYSIVVRPGAITSIGFGGISDVHSIQVTMWDTPGGNVVHSQIYGLEEVYGIDPHWPLYFTAPTYADMYLIDGLPVYPGCEVSVTLTGYTSKVSAGLIAFGTVEEVGSAEMNVEVSVRDYGYTTTDKWGNSTRTPGAKGIDLQCSGVVEIGRAKNVRKTLVRLVDSGGMYFPSTKSDYKFTWTYGLLKPGKISVDNTEFVRIDFEVEGNI